MTTAYASEHAANGYPSPGAYANGHGHSMDGRQPEYAQAPPDQASAAQYSQGQVNSSGTPNSDYGLNPPSARSTQFPQYQEQRYPPPHSGQPSNMAQSSNPSIAASSPTYPPQHHYAPYPGQPDMPPYQPPPGMYPRPGEYPPHGYAHPHAMPAYHVPGQPPVMGRPAPPGGGHPLSTVYSFVPIPGTHQQKRPRRRYEEIERMYKCGWNGCEKAYGTLNHLNAHVTMQAHGAKRTPEEFKEIRKEWKQRKKDEDNARKAEEERHRQAVQQSAGQVDGQNSSEGGNPPSGAYPPGVQRQLPPLGYAPAGGQVSAPYPQPTSGMDGMPQYSSAQVQTYYPPSPYGQANPMYQQNHAPPSGHEQPVAADN